jgi:cytosine/adenosine deaminase-related metal-dependent hydrolase
MATAGAAVTAGGINFFSLGCGAPAQQAQTPQTTGGLPNRGEFIIRNAYVMTMEPALGDLTGGQVHVRNGEIVAVGANVNAPGATVIEGKGMIVLPGMVDTHWHMWNTILRSFDGERAAEGYFPRTTAFGRAMAPDDMYQSTRLACAEAIHSGITTVHNYCHNAQSRAHAEADIRALREAGLRGRWSYGWPQGHPDSMPVDLAAVEGVHSDWAKLSGDGLLTMGFAWRGMVRPSGPLPPQVYRTEFEKARSLSLPISTHVGSAENAKGQVAALGKEKLLGPDVQLIHALSANPAELKMVADSKAVMSVSPRTEMHIGYGIPHLGEVLDAGITTGLSTDTLVLAGKADFFNVMDTVRNIEKGRNHDEFKLSARRVLELGTIEGARSLGLDRVTGSLMPGKRADLIMVSTHSINLGVFTDPAQMIVEAAQPENVDTVIVDGRILKRGGKLTAVSEDEILNGVNSALDGLRKRVTS